MNIRNLFSKKQKEAPKQGLNQRPYTNTPPENIVLPTGFRYKNGYMQLEETSKTPQFRLKGIEAGQHLVVGDEKQTTVKLNTFFVAEFPVTQALWQAVMHNNPSKYIGQQNPVDKVSWLDCAAFCNKINETFGLEPPYKKTSEDRYEWQVTGAHFRMPTEVEWACAARAGQETKYAGSNKLRQVGWYDDNNEYSTMPVGLKFSNAWGLYDMSGNVWEWCWDDYVSDSIEKLSQINVAENPYFYDGQDGRVLRGGSWHSNAHRSRLQYRNDGPAGIGWSNSGFRLVFAH